MCVREARPNPRPELRIAWASKLAPRPRLSRLRPTSATSAAATKIARKAWWEILMRRGIAGLILCGVLALMGGAAAAEGDRCKLLTPVAIQKVTGVATKGGGEKLIPGQPICSWDLRSGVGVGLGLHEFCRDDPRAILWYYAAQHRTRVPGLGDEARYHKETGRDVIEKLSALARLALSRLK